MVFGLVHFGGLLDCVLYVPPLFLFTTRTLRSKLLLGKNKILWVFWPLLPQAPFIFMAFAATGAFLGARKTRRKVCSNKHFALTVRAVLRFWTSALVRTEGRKCNPKVLNKYARRCSFGLQNGPKNRAKSRRWASRRRPRDPKGPKGRPRGPKRPPGDPQTPSRRPKKSQNASPRPQHRTPSYRDRQKAT